MAECNAAVDFIRKMFRLDEGLQDVHLRQSPSDVSFFVDFLDTKDWGDIIKDWFLMLSGEIPNKKAPRFKTCLDDSEWFSDPSSLKIRKRYPMDKSLSSG